MATAIPRRIVLWNNYRKMIVKEHEMLLITMIYLSIAPESWSMPEIFFRINSYVNNEDIPLNKSIGSSHRF
jgi:hypothetical protein